MRITIRIMHTDVDSEYFIPATFLQMIKSVQEKDFSSKKGQRNADAN